LGTENLISLSLISSIVIQPSPESPTLAVHSTLQVTPTEYFSSPLLLITTLGGVVVTPSLSAGSTSRCEIVIS